MLSLNNSFEYSTLTNPTGTPIINEGSILPLLIYSSNVIKAVGALPTEYITGPLIKEALSTHTHALVTFLSFASLATSSSAIKHLTLTPNLLSLFLLIPAKVILVSVTIVAAFFINSRALNTASSLNFSVSLNEKSAVV